MLNNKLYNCENEACSLIDFQPLCNNIRHKKFNGIFAKTSSLKHLSGKYGHEIMQCFMVCMFNFRRCIICTLITEYFLASCWLVLVISGARTKSIMQF